MKKSYLIVFLCLFLIPISVFATSQNSAVWSGTNVHTCTSKYQDKSITTNGGVYFSHCMEAKCQSANNYKISYYSNNGVTCTNGNKNPYVQSINTNKCDNLGYCDRGQIKYCSIILYYDCSRTINGSNYVTSVPKTTKKTTKRTTRRTTKRVTNVTTTTVTTTTTTKVQANTKLKSLYLSSGNINFIPELFEYTINVDSTVNSINVTALPEDSSSKVEIKNNNNIVKGSVISIIVTGSDNSFTEYKINVIKEEKPKSSNAFLKSLSISEYKINFDKTINEYNIVLKNEIKSLTIDYQAEDELSNVTVLGNSDIKNGSIVTINVKAEDNTENSYKIRVRIKEKSNALKIIFIIVLILALIAGGYYVYVKFIQNKKSGDKYEYE